MAQKSIQGSKDLAKRIRQRRNELGMTIEEAAYRADVGTKTWCRYEAGGSIRLDKCRGICKALNWRSLPGQEAEEDPFAEEAYRESPAWSRYLEKNYGAGTAVSFAMGSDVLLDHIQEDLHELSSLPKGSHLGQLDFSCIGQDLPEQFLVRYDYEFLYRMKCELLRMRQTARMGGDMIAHTVLQELILYLCAREASAVRELGMGENVPKEESEEWMFDLFGDMDIVTWLYSDMYVTEDNMYHFVHWNEQQFYMDT